MKRPIDQLKIDQSFIRNLHKGKAMKAVVSTVVNMGKELNMRVIAEGIEEEDQLQYLRSIDCPAGQGYLLKRPIATKGIEDLF